MQLSNGKYLFKIQLILLRKTTELSLDVDGYRRISQYY